MSTSAKHRHFKQTWLVSLHAFGAKGQPACYPSHVCRLKTLHTALRNHGASNLLKAGNVCTGLQGHVVLLGGT